MDISVVIPLYGCRAALFELHERLTFTLQELCKEYEIILVNDFCPQNSWEDIQTLCRQDEHVVGLELSRNFGQIQAITAGLDYSRGDYVVVMDCDLQDRPEEIKNLYAKLLEGYDAVFVRRMERKDSTLKVLASNLFYKIYSFATDGKYDQALCNFSILRRIVVENYCRMREAHRAYVMYIRWMGFRQTTLDVEHDNRKEGKSSYNFKKRWELAVGILTSQSDKLLRLMVMIGSIICLLSFAALLCIVIARLLIADLQSGWPSLMAITCFFGGSTILCIGLVGIYVGNIFMQTKQRPLYIVRTALNWPIDRCNR